MMSKKGSQFERDFCKRISQWWSAGERDDLFWRSAGSGARASTRHKKGRRTAGQHGDVAATDSDGKELTDWITFELKTGYAGDPVQSLFDSNESIKPKWEAWLGQAREAAAAEGTPHWAVVHQRLRKRAVVVMSAALAALLPDIGAVGYMTIVSRRTEWLHVMLLDDFLKMDVQRVREAMQGKQHICKECGAIHYYHFRYCAQCKEPNPKEPSIRGKRHKTPPKSLIALSAVVDTLRGIPGVAPKKKFLLSAIRKNKSIRKYLRIAYEPNIRLGFTAEEMESFGRESPLEPIETIVDHIMLGKIGPRLAGGRLRMLCERYGEPFYSLMKGMIDKNLKIGLRSRHISEVLESSGAKPLESRRSVKYVYRPFSKEYRRS